MLVKILACSSCFNVLWDLGLCEQEYLCVWQNLCSFDIIGWWCAKICSSLRFPLHTQDFLFPGKFKVPLMCANSRDAGEKLFIKNLIYCKAIRNCQGILISASWKWISSLHLSSTNETAHTRFYLSCERRVLASSILCRASLAAGALQ